MREQLPQISYERGMNHNYMVLSECDFFGMSKNSAGDYRVRMLLENKIKGLLPVTYRQVNGESKYYYEINSLQSLDRMLEKRELKYREMRAVLLGCINLFEQLEEYLLSGEQIIIRAEFIYVNVESMEPYFVCYPEYKGDVRVSFMEFTDMLLTRIDHTDEQAVMLGYQVYRYTRNPNYVLDEIRGFMEYMPEPDLIKKDLDEKAVHDFHFEASEANLYNNTYTEKADVKNITDTGFEKTDLNFDREREYGTGENAEESISCAKGDIKELAGGIFCIFIALCAGAIIAGARVLKCFKLSDKNELYMYGAIAMAVTAAVLFFSCYVKSRKQQYIENALPDEKSDNYTKAVYEEHIKRDIVIKNTLNKISEASAQGAGETVCLGNERIEERILRGRVNGREVNMSLECLPVTIGKLGSVSDFIINDDAVSKMHARFEEHEGRVCVCDLNSTNGTIRNGEQIAINTPIALEPGDKLRFGRSCFTYC